MQNIDPQFLEVGSGASKRRIAYLIDRNNNSQRAGLIWLPGFNSDMSSTKATAVANYAQRGCIDCLRFDYSGHGLSEGDFQKGTIGDWLEEAQSIFTRLTKGPQILVGSSMGGYIALLLLRYFKQINLSEANRIVCLILIAPAWDMTEELMWKKLSSRHQKQLVEKGVILQSSEYGEPYRITRLLIEEGRQHLMAGQSFNPGRPIFILQGLKDTAVSPDHIEALKSILEGDWVTQFNISDGEHRLSRTQDLKKLYEILDIALNLSQEGLSV